MFANLIAITTLIESDSTASQSEKDAVLRAVRCESTNVVSKDSKVLSISDAAQYLGRSRKSIHHLLRTGAVKGFYSGKKHTRATGVTKESLDEAISVMRGS